MSSPHTNWQRIRNILAFPHGWQRPAKTEEWAYERCLADLPENRFAQMLCFPWATLIDLQRRGKIKKAAVYLNALQWAPPKTTLIRATVMQHIYAKDMLPILERLGITDIFWSHATNTETRIGNIRIHPFPLYPACCSDDDLNPENWIPLHKRKYLYSFIGAYQPGLYLTEARRWIFELPRRGDAIVERRNEWHFEAAVYGVQIEGISQNEKEIKTQYQRENQYREVLRQSVFSLCPSGSGPNTIRLWESIFSGTIPVVISDQFILPDNKFLWDKTAIFIPEINEHVSSIPRLLMDLVKEKECLNVRLENLTILSQKYLENGLIGNLCHFFSTEWKTWLTHECK